MLKIVAPVGLLVFLSTHEAIAARNTKGRNSIIVPIHSTPAQ